MDEEAQLEALQAAVAAKQARLLELRTKYYQSQQCLQNLSQKYPTINENYQVFAAPLFQVRKDAQDQRLYHLKIANIMSNGLRDLEAWEYGWLSVVRPERSDSASNTVGKLTDAPVAITLRESDNINVSLIDQIKQADEDKFTWAFSRNEQVPSRGDAGLLDLVLVKVEKVDKKQGEIVVQSDEDLTQLQILDFKVYHTVVESVTNLEQK